MYRLKYIEIVFFSHYFWFRSPALFWILKRRNSLLNTSNPQTIKNCKRKILSCKNWKLSNLVCDSVVIHRLARMYFIVHTIEWEKLCITKIKKKYIWNSFLTVCFSVGVNEIPRNWGGYFVSTRIWLFILHRRQYRFGSCRVLID